MPEMRIAQGGWRLSGFRHMAHWIYVGEDGYMKTRCGAFWRMTDEISSIPGDAETHCKKCERALEQQRHREVGFA